MNNDCNIRDFIEEIYQLLLSQKDNIIGNNIFFDSDIIIDDFGHAKRKIMISYEVPIKNTPAKSEEILLQAASEDNDLKSLGLYNKALREKRLERFENYKEELLTLGHKIREFEGQGKFMIENTKFGIIDYYPKANKVLIRKDNKWIYGGLRWIIKNLIK